MLDEQYMRARANGSVRAVHGEVARLTPGAIVVTSAAGAELSLPCDVLISATGFKKSYSYLPRDEVAAIGVEPDGLYLYRHMFPAHVTDLAFLGSEFATISNVASYAVCAEYISRVLSGRVTLPSPKRMADEIDKVKTWKRGWMHNIATRANMILLHQASRDPTYFLHLSTYIDGRWGCAVHRSYALPNPDSLPRRPARRDGPARRPQVQPDR